MTCKVVTRKKDEAQIRIVKEFATHIVWDELGGVPKAALSAEAMQLTPVVLFWSKHWGHRIMACGHQQGPHVHTCAICAWEKIAPKRRAKRVPCADGRRAHEWKTAVNGVKACRHCSVKAVYDLKTMNLLRYET